VNEKKTLRSQLWILERFSVQMSGDWKYVSDNGVPVEGYSAWCDGAQRREGEWASKKESIGFRPNQTNSWMSKQSSTSDGVGVERKR
jgi:hypothetical protein